MMEVVTYIVISILTFAGITSLPSRWVLMVFGPRSPDLLNFFPIFGAIIIWNIIDSIYLGINNKPIPILLFLICWAIKLVEGNIVKKADWQTHVSMAEAWVVFIWAIASMFGDYRAWL